MIMVVISCTQSSDDEPSEEKDRFVAQLYKFMDDRGTPINKAPLIANRDLNLYRLFRLVQNLGGYNKVTISPVQLRMLIVLNVLLSNYNFNACTSTLCCLQFVSNIHVHYLVYMYLIVSGDESNEVEASAFQNEFASINQCIQSNKNCIQEVRHFY